MAALLLVAAATRALKVVITEILSYLLSVKAPAGMHTAICAAAEGCVDAVIIF
jgi:hypothetical protein